MMRKPGFGLLAMGVAFTVSATAAAQQKPPYWASLAAGEARMRTGPGRQFPASWLYQRADLPVKVVEVYQDWRKVEDPDGTQGWMLASLLSNDRTGLIIGEIRPLRDAPDVNARIIWRAEPGVVGQISDCAKGWCKIDVRGRMGYVETSGLWGVSAGESKR
ncbi:MAG: SH3 domain-containing protein [Sphingomonadaceae bacterium]